MKMKKCIIPYNPDGKFTGSRLRERQGY